MKPVLAAAIFGGLILAACASAPAPYGPAASEKARGYTSQMIETGRHRVSYRAADAVRARDLALLRAAELTLAEGADWFRVTNAYTDGGYDSGRGNSSVSIGGSSGSYGSGVGVGVGIGLGGGGSREATHVLEILTGRGTKPDDPQVYDARSVAVAIVSQ